MRILFTILALFALAACSTADYAITSNPPGASIYYLDQANQKKFLMGSTPLAYSKGSLPNDRPFLLVVEKEGFFQEQIPIAPTDEMRTSLHINMKQNNTAQTTETKTVNEVSAQLFKAQHYIHKKRFQAALMELDQLLQKYPTVVQGWVMKGTAYYLLKETGSAVEAWKKAKDLDPNNEELNRFLAEQNLKIR